MNYNYENVSWCYLTQNLKEKIIDVYKKGIKQEFQELSIWIKVLYPKQSTTMELVIL